MKIKSSKIFRAFMVLLVIGLVFTFAGCGKEVEVKVYDGNLSTVVTAKTNMTVQDVLDEAGVVLGEKDKTQPEADTKLDGIAEIVVKRYAKVTVKNGKEEKNVELVGGTVGEAVNEAGYTLNEKLKADADEDRYLEEGMVITLSNAVEVTLKVDGSTKKCFTHAETVEDFLKEQDITLDEDDEFSPAADKKIKEGGKIVVKRVEYKEETKTEVIPFETKETKDSSMSAGEKKVTQEGKNGEKEVTYKIKYVDGKEKSREPISEKVIKEAVTELVTVGTASNNSQQGGKTVVSKQAVYDCDGSGHGYYVITYSDGSVEYEEF